MDAAHVPGARMVSAAAMRERVLAALDVVVDPEIPVLTIAELGILRDAIVADDRVTVVITPTYSGCPAMELIESQIIAALEDAGWHQVAVETSYDPPWTTDAMSDTARRKLATIGIAPPRRRAADPPEPVLCPRCAADETRPEREFGSTACKALMVCSSCGEPFDRFKAI